MDRQEIINGARIIAVAMREQRDILKGDGAQRASDALNAFMQSATWGEHARLLEAILAAADRTKV